MDGRIPTQVRRDPLWFISRLSSAFYELVLIILLHAHTLLSNLIYSFARYCELQIPCMLCARINRKDQFFDKELVCDGHKLEVSSLAYCHTHRCLAFARDMCDACIISFLDEFVQNPDDGMAGDEMTKVPLLKEDSELRRRCSCCSRFYSSRPVVQILLGNKQTDKPSHSMAPTIKEKRPKPLMVVNSGNIISRVGSSEVKITCDTESEVLVSEEDAKKPFVGRGINDVKEELLSRCIQGSISENLTELDGNGKSISNSQVGKSQASTNIGHGLEEISWNQVQLKPNISISSEITSEPVPVEYPSTKLDNAADTSSLASHGDVTKSSNPKETSLKTKNITNDKPKVPIPGLDSLYESVNEIEGESEIDRLKRQIEVDRKSMSALYKELEEERNASAIAANQAMAMINRLQEEKASMQMEALQYLRMMEEQAEYDQEALQKLNDLLADKDEEIQDLEAVVDSYRMQTGEETLPKTGAESFDGAELKDYTPVSTPRFIRSRGRDVGKALVRNTVLDFEDEKVCISESLRKLEMKVKNLSKKMENGGNKEDDIEKLQSTPSFKTIPLSIKQAFKESKLRSISYNDRQGLMGSKSNDTSDLKSEISELRSKLEDLEEDRNFLEHAVNSLRNGSSGIQFIQEIASHLRELRNIGNRQQV